MVEKQVNSHCDRVNKPSAFRYTKYHGFIFAMRELWAKLKRHLPLSVFMFWMFFAQSVLADIDLRVIVKDRDGNPIQGAYVKVTTADVKLGSAFEAYTDSNGLAQINPLRVGDVDHTIIVSKIGYKTKMVTVFCEAWTTKTVNVELKLKMVSDITSDLPLGVFLAQLPPNIFGIPTKAPISNKSMRFNYNELGVPIGGTFNKSFTFSASRYSYTEAKTIIFKGTDFRAVKKIDWFEINSDFPYQIIILSSLWELYLPRPFGGPVVNPAWLRDRPRPIFSPSEIVTEYPGGSYAVIENIGEDGYITLKVTAKKYGVESKYTKVFYMNKGEKVKVLANLAVISENPPIFIRGITQEEVIDPVSQTWEVGPYIEGDISGKESDIKQIKVITIETDSFIKLIDTPLTAIAGQPKLIKVQVVNQSITSTSNVKLFCLTGGQPASSSPMFDDGQHSDGAANDGVWARELPASNVNLNGLAFYIVATDINNQKMYLPNETETNANKAFVVEITDDIVGPEADDGKTYGDITAYNGVYAKGQIPAWKSSADWTMISFPVVLPDPDPEKVFVQWGNPETDWQAYQFNGGADYDRAIRIARPVDPRGDVEKFTSMASGKAAWIWPGDNPRTITVKGAKAHNLTKPFAIKINSGWNQIGNPFRFARIWDKTVKFGMTNDVTKAVDINAAAAQNLIANPAIINQRSGLGYIRIASPKDDGTVPAGTVKGNLEPWQGYWFLAKRDGYLFIDPTVAGPTSIPPGAAPAYEPPTIFKGWMVELSANGIKINAGMGEDAINAQDNLDLPTPPFAASDTIRFAFARPEWNDRFAAYFDQDIRTLSRDGATWEIDVKSDGKPITITWEQIYEVPPEYILMLVDPITGISVDLSKESSYTLTGEGARKLYFVVSISDKGIPEFLAKLMVKKTELLQNFPNPFNPDTWIPYQLADTADVSIRIYDIIGRLVRTLNLGRKESGFYLSRDRAAYWDGRNEMGERVASGVYFYQLQAGSFSGSMRKMLMVK